MDDIYKNVENCGLNKKRKILIVFDNMIANMHSNKKLNNDHLQIYIYIFFYNTILFRGPKKYETKFNAPFSFVNSTKKRENHQIDFNR